MDVKGERTRGRMIILFFIVLLIGVGSVSYFYYTRHKEPTQGIFVNIDDQEVGKEEIASGHLY